MQPVSAPQTKPCPICGEQIAAVARKCRFCGEYLDPSARPKPQSQHSDLDRLVMPVDVEPSALAAGYLGLFSFIPFLGLPLGIAAIVLGRKALRVLNETSDTRLSGRGRAILGITLGGLTTLFNGAGLLMALVSALFGKR